MCTLNQSLLAQTLHFTGPTGLWGAFPPFCLAVPLLFQRLSILMNCMTKRMQPKNIYIQSYPGPNKRYPHLWLLQWKFWKDEVWFFGLNLAYYSFLTPFSMLHFPLYPFLGGLDSFPSQVVLRGPACDVASYRATGLVRGCCSFRMAFDFFLVGDTHPWDGNFDGWELWCKGLCVRAGKIHTILGTSTSLGINNFPVALS